MNEQNPYIAPQYSGHTTIGRRDPAAAKLTLPWLSLGLLLVLLTLAPFAISLPPCAAYTTDSLYLWRSAAVLFGLVATIAAFAEFVVSLLRTRANIIAIVPFAAAFLACAVVGWRSYPYWAAGAYQVHIGTFPRIDLDPKGVAPMVWIGELWRLPVLLLEIACWLAAPLLGAMGIVAIYRRQVLCGSITVLCVGIALTCMLRFSPEYGAWLID